MADFFFSDSLHCTYQCWILLSVYQDFLQSFTVRSRFGYIKYFCITNRLIHLAPFSSSLLRKWWHPSKVNISLLWKTQSFVLSNFQSSNQLLIQWGQIQLQNDSNSKLQLHSFKNLCRCNMVKDSWKPSYTIWIAIWINWITFIHILPYTFTEYS